jgi:hypothetical protein
MENRIFVIYAAEDHQFFDRLAEQARTARLAVTFERMQAKQPWVPSWKGQCRTRMFNSDGAIVLITKKISKEAGVNWELQCAREAQTPVIGVFVDKFDKGALPEGFGDATTIEWNWPEIASFIQSVKRSSKTSSA